LRVFGFACLQYGIADGIEGDGGFDVWMLDALTPDTIFTAGGNAPVSSLVGARFRFIALATRGVRRLDPALAVYCAGRPDAPLSKRSYTRR
jgi:hypothetical protein